MSLRIAKRPRAIPVLFLGFFLVLASISSGCTPKASEPLKTGARPFAFDDKKVTDLLISRFDPVTGDDWTAAVRPGQPNWVFTSAPEGRSLADPMANGGFFAHLLDTLRTIQVSGLAPEGPAESFGLGHPWFALRWNADGKVFELKLSVPRDYASYAIIALSTPGTGDGSGLKKDPHIYEVRGAAIRMLEMVSSFDYLRHHTWSTLSSDEINEIEIKKQGQPWLYAQRDGADWADRRHHRLKKDADSLLDQLTHTQILRFEDDLAQKDDGKTLARLKNSATFEIRLAARGHSPLVLWLKRGKASDTDYGGASDRPRALFSLYRTTAEMLEKAR